MRFSSSQISKLLINNPDPANQAHLGFVSRQFPCTSVWKLLIQNKATLSKMLGRQFLEPHRKSIDISRQTFRFVGSSMTCGDISGGEFMVESLVCGAVSGGRFIGSSMVCGNISGGELKVATLSCGNISRGWLITSMVTPQVVSTDGHLLAVVSDQQAIMLGDNEAFNNLGDTFSNLKEAFRSLAETFKSPNVMHGSDTEAGKTLVSDITRSWDFDRWARLFSTFLRQIGVTAWLKSLASYGKISLTTL